MITIPTTKQLYDSVLASLEAENVITIPLFGKSFLRALAIVQAAKLKLIYLVLGDLQKNIFVDTAYSENQGGTLERFGRVKLGRNPFPAVAGNYTLQVTGEIGATINAKTTFKSNDDSLSPSKLFVLDIEYILVSETDTILVRALETGLDSKLSIGDKLTSTQPIALVNSIATVTVENIEPLAPEDTEEYRQKAIEAYQLEPQGGAATDYRIWSADAQGVANSYPYTSGATSNEVAVYIEATITDSIDGKGTPGAGILAEVEDVIEFDPDTTRPLNERGRRPMNCILTVLPITVKEVDVEIAGFDGLTPEIETIIFEAIEAALSLTRPFIPGADVLANKNDIVSVNKLIVAIQTANPASVYESIELTVSGNIVNSYTFDNGEIPHLNSVNYI